MNADIGTEAAQFPEKEYIIGIFVAVLRHKYKDKGQGIFLWFGSLSDMQDSKNS